MDAINEYLSSRFEQISPFDFYRDIFPAGELEEKGVYTQGKYTGVVVCVTSERNEKGKVKIKRYSITDDLQAINKAVSSSDFCLCSPISYAGKNRTAVNARFLYAIAIDLDHVRKGVSGYPLGLAALWERHIIATNRLPRPSYIVSSGTGLHLYFVFEKPIPLFKNVAVQLQDYKRELTRLVWHDTIVDIKSIYDIQQEGIYQGFRMPGTITKAGERAIAYKTGSKVTMEYLNGFVSPPYRVTRFAYKTTLCLNEAQKKWPDWYERRIVRGENRRTWATGRAVYDWWLKKILDGATVGHRYYCVMLLAIYARKCSLYDEKHNPNPVTKEELEKDCFSLIEHFDSLTSSEDNHFGVDDVLDALEAYEDRWITYPRTAIEYRSGIPVPANKRNGRKQDIHLRIARATQNIVDPDGAWREGNGRKSKAGIVHDWKEKNPDGKKADCIRETGLSKTTVYKHWSM